MNKNYLVYNFRFANTDISFVVRCTYSVKIKQDGPIVRGATITFKAVVYYGDEIDTNDNLRYQWKDNAIPQHTRSVSVLLCY